MLTKAASKYLTMSYWAWKTELLHPEVLMLSKMKLVSILKLFALGNKEINIHIKRNIITRNCPLKET